MDDLDFVYRRIPKEPEEQTTVIEPSPKEKEESLPELDFSYRRIPKAPEPPKKDTADIIFDEMIAGRDPDQMTFQERADLGRQIEEEFDKRIARGESKGLLSGLTAGFSQRIDALKEAEDEYGFGAGELMGLAVPGFGIYKTMSIPLKYLPNAYKWSTRLAKTAIGGASGGALEAIHETGKGEDLDWGNIALATGMGAGLDVLVRGAIATKRWMKSIPADQAEKMLVNGIIPDDLPPTAYKTYQNEVVPEMQALAKEEYATLAQQAEQDAKRAYQQEINNVRAQHEAELEKIALENQASEQAFAKGQQQYNQELGNVRAQHESDLIKTAQDNEQAEKAYQRAQEQYNQKLKQVAAEHEFELKKINEANELAETEFQEAHQAWQEQQARDELVENALKDLKTEISEMISRNEITDTRTAGEAMTKAIRATDEVAYNKVNKLYTKADQLNANIIGERTELINELTAMKGELETIPKLSTPESQKLATINSILDTLEKGPMDNKTILDQAKSLRYIIDFDFSHGNAKGIFKPVINALEDSAQKTALLSGNKKAYKASQKARKAYAQWTRDYNNDYINKFRDRSNYDYSANFKNALNIDNYHPIENVLGQSYDGMQLSNQIRREIVRNNLAKYIENPSLAHGEEFKRAIAELSSVTGAAENEIVQAIQAGKELNLSPIKGKLTKPEKPAPKTIEKVNIPLFKGEKPAPKQVEQVKIPQNKAQKPELKSISQVKIPKYKAPAETPEMRALAKLQKITPEQAQAMTDSPSGIRGLKKTLSRTPEAKRLYEKISKQKLKSMFQKGKVTENYTGDQLFDVINNENNFDLIAEIMGEEEVKNLLVSAKLIGEQKISADKLKKLLEPKTLHTIILLGLL